MENVTDKDYELMKERGERVKYWLEEYAPDFVKFSIKKELPKVNLSTKEKDFLTLYLESLRNIRWNGEQLHRLVHEKADEIGMNKGKAFRVFYKILLGKNKGPRLGRFLSQLDRDFVAERVEEALKA